MTTTSLATVQTDSVVVSLMRASSALAEARTIQQTKKVLDIAAAAEVYARRQHLGLEIADQATAIKVEALRKLGDMLRAAPKAKGAEGLPGGGTRGSKKAPRVEEAPTLAELGLSKKESAVAQKLAGLSEEAFEQVRDGHTTIAKAIAAVEAGKTTPAVATPRKTARQPTPAQTERDQAAEDAYGDVDLLAEFEAARAEILELQELVAAIQADDPKAEALKWRRAYDNAVRQQSEAMASAARSVEREKFAVRQLARCGKAVGEADPTKIAAAVEAFVRARGMVVA